MNDKPDDAQTGILTTELCVNDDGSINIDAIRAAFPDMTDDMISQLASVMSDLMFALSDESSSSQVLPDGTESMSLDDLQNENPELYQKMVANLTDEDIDLDDVRILRYHGGRHKPVLH